MQCDCAAFAQQLQSDRNAVTTAMRLRPQCGYAAETKWLKRELERLRSYCNVVAKRSQRDCASIAKRLLHEFTAIAKRMRSECKVIANRLQYVRKTIEDEVIATRLCYGSTTLAVGIRKAIAKRFQCDRKVIAKRLQRK
jgi:hypothetical protein